MINSNGGCGVVWGEGGGEERREDVDAFRYLRWAGRCVGYATCVVLFCQVILIRSHTGRGALCYGG